MARVELTMPQLGTEITEAQVDLWHKAVGDSVETDEEIVTITTPKVTMDLEAPAGGTLAEILVEEDAIAPVGAVLAIIES
ncbi:MAG: lipoyl domain-containing protein [Pseudomonadota bacterium]